MEKLSILDHLTLSDNSFTWRFKNEWITTAYELANKFVSKPSKYLEIGAGVHNPLGCALISLGKGAVFAAAVEPGNILPESIEQASILGLIALTHEDVPSSWLLEELKGMLFHDNVPQRIIDQNFSFSSKNMELFNGFLEDYRPSTQFDVIHSNAVFEHIMDIDGVCRRMFELTAPGGVHVHKVDFIDHGYYEKLQPTADDAFNYMFIGEEDNIGDSNGLRLSQVQSAFIRNGFESCGVFEQWKMPFTEVFKERLQDRYAVMDIDDLSTTCATIVFRKPINI